MSPPVMNPLPFFTQLLFSQIIPHFHTSENYRTKYIVKNDNEFMTEEKYDYMNLSDMNLSDYSTLPDLKEV